jgi:hypothetical protein
MSNATTNQDLSDDKVNFTKSKFPVEYKHWKNMRRKCYSPSYKGFYLYGGKGVTVSDRWWDFAKFLGDIGARPSKRHSIILRPGEKEYSTHTAKWMTPEESFHLGCQGSLGPDDSNLEAKPGIPDPRGPSSDEDFAEKRVSYIHCFINLLCTQCGGKLWIHPATQPDPDGFSDVECFECQKSFRWKRTDTLIS